ncbi:MAG: hypothetical protein Q9219_004161 [cf. Caloplaca sp. 3 TL-2023]
MDSTSTLSSVDASPSQQQTSWAAPRAQINGPSEYPPLDPDKNPAAISLRAFTLGLVLGTSLTLTVLLQQTSVPLWRAPFFFVALSIFHLLEFYITARYNPSAATTSAFLLTSNGYAYNVAHTLALIECISGNYLAPRYFPAWTPLHSFYAWLSPEGKARGICLALGLASLALGQGIRTLAMVHAATNFNHLVQFRKKEGHVLVTDGIYRWMRHPAYSGFFWWGLGTQVVMGNKLCFIGYAVVLWRFFKDRIDSKYPLP